MNLRSLTGSAFLHVSLILAAGIGWGVSMAASSQELPLLNFRPTALAQPVAQESPARESVEVEHWEESPELQEPALSEDFAPSEVTEPLVDLKPGWDPGLMEKLPASKASQSEEEVPLPIEPPQVLPAAYIPPQARTALNEPPEYPRLARRRGLEGEVLLELSIDDHGKVQSVELLRPCRHPALNAAAIRAAKTWQYEPATRHGRASSDRITERVVFRIEG